MTSVEELVDSEGRINVFGYGSLIWHPDFEYDASYLGYIKGYERRFWQGSTHHRGTVEKPGRVLTMRKVDEGKCWGRVFVISGSKKIRRALGNLQTREQSLGHYDAIIMPVHIKDSEKQLVSVVYYATPKNPLYLGDGSPNVIADDIATSYGAVGHNAEYLLRLTDFMRAKLPQEEDPHLYELDRLVRLKLGLGLRNILPWEKLFECPSFSKRIMYSKEEDVHVSECVSSPIHVPV